SALHINLGTQQDHFTVNSTHAGSTSIDGGAGDDQIDLNELDGPTTVHGGADNGTITLHATKVVGHRHVLRDGGHDLLLVNHLTVGTTDPVDLDGGAGMDSYEVDITGAGGYLVNVHDSGADTSTDTLTINGTDQPDNFLLRASQNEVSNGGIAFVAA